MPTLPTGVEIRGKQICIWFMYKGNRYRETLKGWVISPSNIKKAGNLRAVITSEINLGEFDYLARFPNSKKIIKSEQTIKINTFGELCDIWQKLKETEITASTMKTKKSQLNTLKLIVNEETPINTISHSDILNYRLTLLKGETFYHGSIRKNKIGRASRTVENYISLLCTLLRFGHQSGFIDKKPFEGIKKLHTVRVKPDPLTRDEFNGLMQNISDQQRNLWQFAIYSGLRHGELAALAWEDVDLENGTVHVCRNLTSIGTFGPPKTAAGNRVITLLEPAIEALKAQRAYTSLQQKNNVTFHHREYGKTENQTVRFVFMPRLCEKGMKPHYSLSGISSSWNYAVKHAGIRRRNPYHTRHTFACWLLSAGANPSFIATQMGHENAQMVYSVYGAWIEDLNGNQVKMLNTKLAL